MPHVYAPGGALMLHKPHLAQAVHVRLASEFDDLGADHLTCCRHDPVLEPGAMVVNTCAGCDRRFRELYEGVYTVSLWKVLAESTTFEFPDYDGAEMTVHHACPTRTEDRVHDAVRRFLERMNMVVVEPDATRRAAVCRGDSFFGQLPDERVRELMARRAASMPPEDVVVYCVSCVKAMHLGGRRPRYLVGLLLGEDTEPGVFEPAAWHEQLDAYIERHYEDEAAACVGSASRSAISVRSVASKPARPWTASAAALCSATSTNIARIPSAVHAPRASRAQRCPARDPETPDARRSRRRRP